MIVLFYFSAEKENTFRGIERVCMLKQSPLLFCFHFFLLLLIVSEAGGQCYSINVTIGVYLCAYVHTQAG